MNPAHAIRLQIGPWEVECLPADGARVSRLVFDGFDLLTSRPKRFHRPRADFGRYEIRPVYGYDDCWPTVDPCRYPARNWAVPDHGELCWLPWMVTAAADQLVGVVQSQRLPIRFTRQMRFTKTRLTWYFRIENTGARAVPFLHVMHPLLPLEAVRQIDLPAFNHVWDEHTRKALPLKQPNEIDAFLKRRGHGQVSMLLVQGLAEGWYRLTFNAGPRLRVVFAKDLFPTLAIWWNHAAYPAETGCRRTECAFEPVPGLTSNLADSFAQSTCLSVPSHSQREWTVVWEMK